MKTVLITGGSRGIGAAMVRCFSEAGYSVAFTYKNSVKLAEALSKETGALAVKADSAVEREVTAALEKVKSALGGIDVLVNNAAVSEFSLFSDIDFRSWREMFAVSVDGAFLYTKGVIPEMINKKQGRIINISSIWGITGASCEVHYSAAKAAVIGMTKALAKELGPSGITVNCIAPGVINTDMNKRLSEEDIDTLIDMTPLMRVGEPQEIARTALFLAGDGASFITGDVINASGGYVI